MKSHKLHVLTVEEKEIDKKEKERLEDSCFDITEES